MFECVGAINYSGTGTCLLQVQRTSSFVPMVVFLLCAFCGSKGIFPLMSFLPFSLFLSHARTHVFVSSLVLLCRVMSIVSQIVSCHERYYEGIEAQ